MSATASTPDTSRSNPSVRERMRALGWELSVCEDTCTASWMKVEPGTRRVIAYEESGGRFEADLEGCQQAYGYPSCRSHYA